MKEEEDIEMIKNNFIVCFTKNEFDIIYKKVYFDLKKLTFYLKEFLRSSDLKVLN